MATAAARTPVGGQTAITHLDVLARESVASGCELFFGDPIGGPDQRLSRGSSATATNNSER